MFSHVSSGKLLQQNISLVKTDLIHGYHRVRLHLDPCFEARLRDCCLSHAEARPDGICHRQLGSCGEGKVATEEIAADHAVTGHKPNFLGNGGVQIGFNRHFLHATPIVLMLHY